MAESIGSIATQFANAPLHPDTVQDKPEKRENKGRVQRAVGTIAALFGSITFKLPAKSETFKNDDGSATRKLALALVHFATCPTLAIRANVYERSNIPGASADDYEIYLAMPSSGKGFPQPVFVTDDSDVQAEFNAWKVQAASAYEKWAAGLTNKGSAVNVGAARLVRKRQPTV